MSEAIQPKPQHFTGGERNDIREDIFSYRAYLIGELSSCQSIEFALDNGDDGHVMHHSVSLLRALHVSTDGPKFYRKENAREWKARRDLIEKIEDLEKKSS